MEIKEYALNILAENGCDTHTYGNYPIPCENLTEDLREAYPNGMLFDYRDVASAILAASSPDWEHIPVLGFSFDYWGSHAVYDLYDDARQELRNALDAGTPFNSGWHESAHELQGMLVARDNDKTIVQCASYMDSAFEQVDLIVDCLENEEESILTDDMVEEIRDRLSNSWSFSEDARNVECLPVNASLDDVLEASARLIDLNKRSLDESFRECIACTLSVIYGDSEKASKLIDERISKLCPYQE